MFVFYFWIKLVNRNIARAENVNIGAGYKEWSLQEQRLSPRWNSGFCCRCFVAGCLKVKKSALLLQICREKEALSNSFIFLQIVLRSEIKARDGSASLPGLEEKRNLFVLGYCCKPSPNPHAGTGGAIGGGSNWAPDLPGSFGLRSILFFRGSARRLISACVVGSLRTSCF